MYFMKWIHKNEISELLIYFVIYFNIFLYEFSEKELAVLRMDILQT